MQVYLVLPVRNEVISLGWSKLFTFAQLAMTWYSWYLRQAKRLKTGKYDFVECSIIIYFISLEIHIDMIMSNVIIEQGHGHQHEQM